MSGRAGKSLVNMEVSLLFYFLSLFLTFFSRKIFLDCLGIEFMGLTGTLASILGYLNLAELGIVQCVSFFLYKPLQQGDRRQTCEIMSMLGWLYRWIGTVILVGGIAVSLFFPLVFSSAGMGMGIVYFAFYSFLASSLMGYFINYRQILLTADQKNYLVAVYFQSATMVKTVVQIAVAYYWQDVYIWAAAEVVFGLIGCLVLNRKIDQEYPWLETDKSNGRPLIKKYPEVLRYTRQIFVHKMKDFMLNRSDELFVFAFVSLKMVAFYGNYMLVITRILSMISTVMRSVASSIGNLVAEGNRERTLQVFWEFTTMQHLLAGIVSFGIYTLMEPLITVWLGPEYVMDHAILALLAVFVYISTSRTANDLFNHSYGLYADIWAAWTEFGINVCVTVICGLKWGIAGILMGKIVSLLPIVILWKPYYLFTAGFHEPVGVYWRGVVRNYGVEIASFGLATVVATRLPINPYGGFLPWMLYAALSMMVFIVVSTVGSLFFAKGAKGLITRLVKTRRLQG